MSTTIFRIIPTDYSLSPPPSSLLEAAARKVGEFIPKARSIEVNVFEEVTFIDQGEGFENVSCLECKKELDTDWWQEAMNTAYENKFENLECICPLCGSSTNLNELNYNSPAGFSRFAIVVKDPDRAFDLEPEKIKELESILNCPLRQIWAHY